MNETIVHLKSVEQWRAGMTREKLISEMNEKLTMPGVTNIWTQPIQNRIDMLSTGIRSQVGLKIFGNDLKELEELSRRVAEVVKTVPGAVDVYPEQISGAPYIDIHINRPAAARYGIDVGMISIRAYELQKEEKRQTTDAVRENFVYEETGRPPRESEEHTNEEEQIAKR